MAGLAAHPQEPVLEAPAFEVFIELPVALALGPVGGELIFTPRPGVYRDPGSGPAIESCPVSRPLQSVLGREVFVAQQQLLVDRPRDVRQHARPPHPLLLKRQCHEIPSVVGR